MSAKEKQTAIDWFQTDFACRGFIGNIQAAGLGISLSSDLTQAEARLHRLGAKDNGLVQHLVLSGSLEAIMVRQPIKKQEVLDGVLSPESVT
jgi:SWI/SNF-related matrix-associated actin-dependent regulator 1 of chromatin subfamily A